MPTTLNSGLQLPDKGSVDWYGSMQTNYNLLDTHLGDTDIHVTAEDKANWDSKQGSLSQAQLDAIAQVSTNTSDIATLQTGKANASHTHSSSDITGINDYATKTYVDNVVTGLVDSAPAALDTLNELAAALNDDANFASTVTTALSAKANSADLATVATSGSYSDLSNKPSIPTKTSDLTNDSNFVDTSNSAVASGITSAKVTAYDSHIADTDIHVTTADKTKWNNGVSQAYVFRYSSTALVASSTNSNTLLDNTDNLKVGDKVIDSTGVLFSITAIDTVNSTFTVGSSLVDLALDSNVVHTSGNESVSGVKTFSDDTYIKSLNFTNEVASTSSSSSAVMPFATTVTYTDQTASKSARINLRITAGGDKSLYPHENNQYTLGLTSRKWSEVHSVTYYYGSSDTEFSTKFVTADTAQDVTANKNFKGLITTTPDSPLWASSNNTTADITSLATNCVHIENRVAGTLTDLSGGAWCVAQIGIGCFFFRYNTGTDIRYKHFATNVVSKICAMSNDNKFLSDLCPDTTNSYNLGDSTYKWATINGLEPSALALPDIDNKIDISSYITDLAGVNNEYTPNVNGWICVRSGNATKISILDSATNIGNQSLSSTATYLTVMTPCIANRKVNINIICTTLGHAYFCPCLGNV